MILLLLEITASCLIVILVLEEIIAPLLHGRPLFPLLNTRQRNLEKEMAQLRQKIHEAELKKEIAEYTRQLLDLEDDNDRESGA